MNKLIPRAMSRFRYLWDIYYECKNVDLFSTFRIYLLPLTKKEPDKLFQVRNSIIDYF